MRQYTKPTCLHQNTGLRGETVLTAAAVCFDHQPGPPTHKRKSPPLFSFGRLQLFHRVNKKGNLFVASIVIVNMHGTRIIFLPRSFFYSHHRLYTTTSSQTTILKNNEHVTDHSRLQALPPLKNPDRRPRASSYSRNERLAVEGLHLLPKTNKQQTRPTDGSASESYLSPAGWQLISSFSLGSQTAAYLSLLEGKKKCAASG